MAAKVCHFCQKPIGYARRFYGDPDNSKELVHADCLEVAVEFDLFERLAG
jgi:hypothetical protein